MQAKSDSAAVRPTPEIFRQAGSSYGFFFAPRAKQSKQTDRGQQELLLHAGQRTSERARERESEREKERERRERERERERGRERRKNVALIDSS